VLRALAFGVRRKRDEDPLGFLQRDPEPASQLHQISLLNWTRLLK
jgi:hypothetical protein